MSKKKSQDFIRDQIYNNYIFGREFSSSIEILKHIDLLVDNNLATHISGTEDLAYVIVSYYKIASKFFSKYDKSFLKNLRTKQYAEAGSERVTKDDNEEIVDLINFPGLDYGIYYIDIGNEKKDDYGILYVKPGDKEDKYIVGYDIYFVGYRHKKFKNKFFNLVDKYEKLNAKKVEMIKLISDIDVSYKPTRFKSFDRMVFAGKEKYLKYIDNWVESLPIYHKYEMIPKLSILLYGEPGTGKSTFAKALAKYLGINNLGIISADYFKSGSSDDHIKRRDNLRSSQYEATVFSIEDIDCICKSREEDDSNENGKILSSLLEFLDNPNTFYFKAKDGFYYPVSIVVATTNYYDRLDAAVKRYGRFDLQIEMKQFNYKQAEELCSLYDLHLKDVYHEKINKDTFSISPAYLQALCMENIDNVTKNNII